MATIAAPTIRYLVFLLPYLPQRSTQNFAIDVCPHEVIADDALSQREWSRYGVSTIVNRHLT